MVALEEGVLSSQVVAPQTEGDAFYAAGHTSRKVRLVELDPCFGLRNVSKTVLKILALPPCEDPQLLELMQLLLHRVNGVEGIHGVTVTVGILMAAMGEIVGRPSGTDQGA
jgi:hypothetical protein